ncbi:MAG: hypothetical protein H7A08_00905 [Oceanospirillaceae bacterium]|nr:hypothetical protein [Oceanospirillaceae bacterium]
MFTSRRGGVMQGGVVLSLVLMLSGLFFIGIAYLGKRIRKNFLSESTIVPGVVVDIKEEMQKSTNRGARIFFLPIIEYKVKSKLRFKAELDATQHKIKIGDSVEVLVSKSNYKIAKLKGSTEELFLILNIMLFLGIGACAVGIHLFNPSDFSFSFIKDPFTVSVIVLGVVFFGMKAAPVVRMFFDHGLNYIENAYEVDNTNV